MKILLINKFYYPKGGAEGYFFALKELLERHGHTVVVFSMEDTRNLPSPYSRYFVSNVDFHRVRFDWQGLRAAGRMLFSFEAKRKLEQLLRDEQPDVAHLFNVYHQLSPSILLALKKYHVPIVHTLCDFKLVSPNYLLSAHGGICEHGKKRRYYECIPHRCVKGSYVATTLAVIEMYIHKLFGFYEKNVDVFMAPSNFLRAKIEEWGVKVKEIRVIPNFVPVPPDAPLTVGNDILFFGRLSEEKGVEDLLSAAKDIPYPVTIVGSGPQTALLHERQKREGLSNVRFLSFQTTEKLQKLIRDCRLVVVPSRCYENMPLAILEAFGSKKPVIAPDLGSMPEIVRPGETGLLYRPGSVSDLREKILTLAGDTEKVKQYGEGAYRFLQQFTSEKYYPKVMQLYEELLARHHK